MATKKSKVAAAKKLASKIKSKTKAKPKRKTTTSSKAKPKDPTERYRKQGQNAPQSKAWTEPNDEGVAAKPVGWRWTEAGAKKVGADSTKRPSQEDIDKYKNKTFKVKGESVRYLYTERRVDKSDKYRSKKFEEGGTLGAGSFKRGGATSVSGRQRPNYREDIDGEKTAKPAGWRFTDKLAKRLGKSATARPTLEEIKKYSGRGVYYERRQDKSDAKPSKKYISLEQGGEMVGADIQGAGMFKRGGATSISGRQYDPYREDIDGEKMAKPAGWRFTDRLAKRLSKSSAARPTAAEIEKYRDRGVYFERRQDKSDAKPSKKYISLEQGGEMVGSDIEGAGMFARGGVARISNAESRTYTENMLPFVANNLEGKTLSNGDYVVLSYGYYPIWYYSKKESKWYGNKDKYSMTTAKHISQSRPTYDATILSKSELTDKMMGNNASFENGGVLDGILSDAPISPTQSVGGTQFSSGDLTPTMDITNPAF